jgi:integrase/recombinase XerD
MAPRADRSARSRTEPLPGPLDVHLAAFLAYLEAECGLADNTLKSYRGDLRDFLGWLTEHHGGQVESLGAVDSDTLRDYLQALRDRRLATSSLARRLSTIRSFYRFLVFDGVLTETAVEQFRSPRMWQRLPKVLGTDVVDRLIAEPGRVDTDRYPLRDRSLLGLLYATGCRASEVTGLRLRDLDLDEGLCRCLGKGNRERLAFIPSPAVRETLADYLDSERPALAGPREIVWLFLTRSGNQLSRVTLWKLVKKYAARAGISGDVSPHTLRHCFATHMLAGGAGIRELQELLGHASVATTQLYTQVEHSRLKGLHEQCHPRG